jgi:hypothetical protein
MTRRTPAILYGSSSSSSGGDIKHQWDNKYTSSNNFFLTTIIDLQTNIDTLRNTTPTTMKTAVLTRTEYSTRLRRRVAYIQSSAHDEIAVLAHGEGGKRRLQVAQDVLPDKAPRTIRV